MKILFDIKSNKSNKGLREELDKKKEKSKMIKKKKSIRFCLLLKFWSLKQVND